MSAAIIELPVERWQEYKELRLKALAEPTAFDITPEEETQRINGDWELEYSKLSSGKSGVVLFAQSGEQLVGMVGAHFGETMKSRHIAVPFGFFVQKEYRGQGLGQKLLEALIEKLKELEIVKINIGVYETQQSAIKLYEKLGFQRVGVLRKELKIADKFYDCYEMEMLLD